MVLLCIALGGVLALQLAKEEPQPGIGPVESPTSIDADPVASPAPFAMPPFDTFAEIAERPLFSRTRRPPSPEEAAVEDTPSASSSGLVLTGVILTAHDRIAFLTTGSSERVNRLREGETLENWTLVSVQPDKVIVSNAGNQREVLLVDTLKMGDSPVRLRAQQMRARQMRAQQLRAQQARARQQAEEQTGETAVPDEQESDAARAQRILERANSAQQPDPAQQNQEEDEERDDPADAARGAR